MVSKHEHILGQLRGIRVRNDKDFPCFFNIFFNPVDLVKVILCVWLKALTVNSFKLAQIISVNWGIEKINDHIVPN